MKKLSSLILGLCVTALSSTTLMAAPLITDLTPELPKIDTSVFRFYQKVDNVAQYKNGDWSNVIGIARGVSISEARQIADMDPNITYFFYTKGNQMILESENGCYRVFKYADAVFFTGEPRWGSAQGLADGYIKLGTDIQ